MQMRVVAACLDRGGPSVVRQCRSSSVSRVIAAAVQRREFVRVTAWLQTRARIAWHTGRI